MASPIGENATENQPAPTDAAPIAAKTGYTVGTDMNMTPSQWFTAIELPASQAELKPSAHGGLMGVLYRFERRVYRRGR
jgi:hypothetical protein